MERASCNQLLSAVSSNDQVTSSAFCLTDIMSELYFSFAISLQKFLLTFDFEFLDPDPHQGHFSHSGSISKINSFFFFFFDKLAFCYFSNFTSRLPRFFKENVLQVFKSVAAICDARQVHLPPGSRFELFPRVHR